jgi:hypothetical protein
VDDLAQRLGQRRRLAGRTREHHHAPRLRLPVRQVHEVARRLGDEEVLAVLRDADYLHPRRVEAGLRRLPIAS